MVPIYSVDCALSLWFPDVAIFIDMARDCYEVRGAFSAYVSQSWSSCSAKSGLCIISIFRPSAWLCW